MTPQYRIPKWDNPDWAYILGAIQGDGSITPRSIEITVSHKELAYRQMIEDTWNRLGFNPKVYRAKTAFRVDVHCKQLRDDIAPWKVKGIWRVPEHISPGDYLAGIIDTDGCVTALPRQQIVITLKRTGNLAIVADMIQRLGMRPVEVKNRLSSYKGTPYEIETMQICGSDRMLIALDCIPLRHPRKKARLQKIVAHIHERQSLVPLWEQVADYLKQEPRTCDEIQTEFNLSTDQAQGALQKIKSYMKVEIIPPPRTLTKYRVKSQ